MRKLIVITGGIGAGKSVVSRVLRLRGYDVYDCDLEAGEIMNRSPQVRESLTDWCGPDIYLSTGELNRKKLSSIFFIDKELREKVNLLVHALVRDDIASKMADLGGNRKGQEERWKDDVFFVETAIPVVSGLAAMADEIWYVTAPEEERIARVAGRDGHEEAHIRARIEAQRQEWDQLPLAKTRTIVNNDATPLIPQLNNVTT